MTAVETQLAGTVPAVGVVRARRNIAQGVAMFSTRQTLFAVGGFDESIFMAEDSDFDTPARCVARRVLRLDATLTLPVGGAIQVGGEEKHLDDLAPLLRPEGECWAYTTLHEIIERTTRTSRTLVEVRINGARVGQLTPKMSAELLPAIHHLADAGVLTSARAIVKGNRIKAEVVLYAARAHELPDSWLNETARTGQPTAVTDAMGADRSQGAPAAGEQESPRQHGPIPPPPTSIRFTVPPDWPTPPPGWVPPPGWRPDPAWPPAPEGWQWWVPTWD